MPRVNQIQLRRDTAANWTSANPTLAAGEVGVETNTGKFKIGNGATAWVSLAYTSDVSTKANLAGGNTFTGTQTLSTPLAVGSGGTGASSLASGGYLKGTGTSAITSQSGIPASDITSGILPIARGGTGVSTGAGMTLVASQNFSSAGSVVLDNIFTSTSQNYRIEIRVDSVTGGTTTLINSFLRQGGSNLSSNYYGGAWFLQSRAGTSSGIYWVSDNASSFRAFTAGTSGIPSYTTIDVLAPNNGGISTQFTVLGQHHYGGTSIGNSNVVSTYGGVVHAQNTAADGIAFVPTAGVMTGSIRVYGYRN
jgi:hypothetical protein